MAVLATTAYLPSASYIRASIQADELFIEQYETYRKQTSRNHCRIYGPNGTQTLSIPVIKVSGNHTLTKDILISYSIPWQRIHWRSIETAYNNSPFFLYYKDHFEPFYSRRTERLIDLNLELLQVILGILGTKKEISFTGLFEKNPPGKVKDIRTVLTRTGGTVDPYIQVFSSKHGFIPNLSILDVIFNLGPEAGEYLAET